MSCCDLDLWPVDLESSWYIKHHVTKVCTKFEWNGAIPGWITDNFVNFCRGVPKFNSIGHVIRPRPLCPLILHFSIVLLVVNLHTEFEVCSLNRSRNIEGVPKFKTMSPDLSHTSFVTYFLHFLILLFVVNLRINFEVCSFSRSRNIEWVPKF